MANQLMDVFWGLQNAHDNIVRLEAKALTLGVIRAYQQGEVGKGEITEAGLADLLGLSRPEIKELDNLRMEATPDPLDQVKELVRVTKDLRLPSGKLSALLVAGALGLTVRQMAGCLDCSAQVLNKAPDADSLQRRLADFERVARLRAVVTNDGFKRWLRKPNQELDDKTPLQLFVNGQGNIVADLVRDMLTGAPA